MANTYDISDFPQILLIDTNNAQTTTVALITERAVTIETQPTRAQELLVLLEELLRKSVTELKAITAIGVVERDGSLTGKRIGVAVANTLAWILNVPLFKLTGEAQTVSQKIHQGTSFEITKILHTN